MENRQPRETTMAPRTGRIQRNKRDRKFFVCIYLFLELIMMTGSRERAKKPTEGAEQRTADLALAAAQDLTAEDIGQDLGAAVARVGVIKNGIRATARKIISMTLARAPTI